MPLIESLIGPIASIIDKIIPDKEARAKAKLELLALEGSQELKAIEARKGVGWRGENNATRYCEAADARWGGWWGPDL